MTHRTGQFTTSPWQPACWHIPKDSHKRLPAMQAERQSTNALYCIGFKQQIQDHVLTQDTGWEQLQHSFVVLDQPALAMQEADSRCTASTAATKATDALIAGAAAAVVVPGPEQLQIIQQLRAADSTMFIACWHPNATEDAAMRWQAFQAGANMVTFCGHALADALHKVSTQQQQPQLHPLPRQQHNHNTDATESIHTGAPLSITCDWCGLPDLTPAGYWIHQQLYHINHQNMSGTCQICSRFAQNLARHIHDSHNPMHALPEERTGVFALAIVRRPSDGRFLMTQEFAGSGFWVPGGGVDPGETLVEGAVRECKEEAGVDVDIKGILTLESNRSGTWRRVIFRAEPVEHASPCLAAAPVESPAHSWRSRIGSKPCCSPKTLPDWESAGACWVSVDELEHLPLRSSSEPCTWFPIVHKYYNGTRDVQLPLVNSLDLPVEWAEGVFKGFPCKSGDSGQTSA